MNETSRRLGGFAIVISMLFVALFGRLALLQTTQQQSMAERAVSNFRSEVPVPATRGRVLDRYGRVLIDNVPVNLVRLDPQKIPKGERARVITRLSSILEVPYDTIESALAKNTKGNRADPVQIAGGVKQSVVIYINEHPELFPGVDTLQTARRVYPFLFVDNGIERPLLAHVLGYVGPITTEELRLQPPDLAYESYDFIGRAGVEKSFERELRGVPGIDEIIKDSTQKVVERRTLIPPLPGSDVRLTVDIDVQRLTETTLGQGVRAARQNYFKEYRKAGKTLSGAIKAHSGAMVVSDVNTGEVVAMASYPTFDPREFVDGITDERFKQLSDPSRHFPLTNRAVSGRYPPGSTFKLVTALTALQTEINGKPIITPKSGYLDVGYFEVPKFKKLGTKYRWYNAGSSAFGLLDLRRAIKVSSDAYFYNIANSIETAGGPTRDAIQKTAKTLGFGRVTNIRLPGEKAGIIPDAARLKRLNQLDPTKFPRDKWNYGDTVNVAIGQGEVLVTPLQLNRAYSAFANGGAVLEQKIEMDIIPRDEKSLAATTTIAATTTTSSTTTTTIGPAATVPPGNEAYLRLPGSVTLSPGVDPATGAVGEPVFDIPEQTTTTLAPVPVAPAVQNHIDLPDEFRQPILAGLRDVVSAHGGTAEKAFFGYPFSKYPIAGKTGTAQKSFEQDYSLFVGFGPTNAPKYVCTAILEEGGFGRQAGALVRRMFEGFAGLNPQPVRVVSSGTKRSSD
jgi:penicillin-binding protein 2